MNRRTFFGMLAGLAGLPFLKAPKSKFVGSWRFTLEELKNPEFNGQFVSVFKYYANPMHPERRLICLHRREDAPYMEIVDGSGWTGKRWNNDKGDWEAI